MCPSGLGLSPGFFFFGRWDGGEEAGASKAGALPSGSLVTNSKRMESGQRTVESGELSSENE